MKANGLLVNQTPSYEGNQEAGTPAQRMGGIDMTKVMIEGFGYSQEGGRPPHTPAGPRLALAGLPQSRPELPLLARH